MHGKLLEDGGHVEWVNPKIDGINGRFHQDLWAESKVHGDSEKRKITGESAVRRGKQGHQDSIVGRKGL